MMQNGFKHIDKVIKAYIKYVLNADEQINRYVPNLHIAELFKDVLLHSELESKNEHAFHNVKYEPYDSIGTNNPDNYIRLEDGRYELKEVYSVGINDILLPNYFDLQRLKADGVEEIRVAYSKLTHKRDAVRNKIILRRIVLKEEALLDYNTLTSRKIKLKSLLK